jgi:ubiquinone/menaquinone biosynthesis C-methylase UbiE
MMGDSTNRKDHWQRVYAEKSPLEVSWYRPHLDVSLELIEASGIEKSGRLIDIGGGSSTLVDDLLAAGYDEITVLDVSPRALHVARRRLGERATAVRWLEGDVTSVELGENRFDLWHDRAALHFLTRERERDLYIAQLNRAVAAGGHVVLATFAPEAPPQCSGLDVRRYDADELKNLLGEDWRLRRQRRQVHRTPAGSEQPFTYCWMQKVYLPMASFA